MGLGRRLSRGEVRELPRRALLLSRLLLPKVETWSASFLLPRSCDYRRLPPTILVSTPFEDACLSLLTDEYATLVPDQGPTC